jgi:carbonic anhydrase/acetyltransferase-like protein (isoleucine patch superfamily)
VILDQGSSIWFGCVLRGDERAIHIGANTNIQDLTVIHTSRSGMDAVIGANVTVGHRVVLHGCTVADSVLIGIGAIVLDGVTIGTGAIVAAGAVVTAGKRIGAGELWAGCPAKKVGEVSEQQNRFIESTPPHYGHKAANYLRDYAS